MPHKEPGDHGDVGREWISKPLAQRRKDELDDLVGDLSTGGTGSGYVDDMINTSGVVEGRKAGGAELAGHGALRATVGRVHGSIDLVHKVGEPCVLNSLLVLQVEDTLANILPAVHLQPVPC